MPRVLFDRVGRDARTFEAEIPMNSDGETLSSHVMMKVLKARKAIVSRFADFDNGFILVGGRTVGTYAIIPEEDK